MKRAVATTVLVLVACASSAVAAPPSITPSITGQAGDNGWYVGNVIVNWTITPPYLVDFGCVATLLDRDTAGTTLECKASNVDGSDHTTVTIRLDKTAPVAIANADRGADAGGFYNRALTVRWSGHDPTSGVAACTSLPYAGPDGTGLSLSGTCRDRAGNISAPVSFSFNYDATPPALADLHANPEDRSAIISWQSSGATGFVVIRTPAGARAAQSGGVVYNGTGTSFRDSGLSNGTKYTYTVQAIDAANNVATDSLTVTPSAAASSVPLLSPRPRAELRRPPMLRWRPIKAASYYNVQLYRKGKKILSAWPKRAHYQVRSKWRYRGRTYRLGKGTYVWYVWGGYGRRSEHRYGKLLGKRSFKVI